MTESQSYWKQLYGSLMLAIGSGVVLIGCNRAPAPLPPPPAPAAPAAVPTAPVNVAPANTSPTEADNGNDSVSEESDVEIDGANASPTEPADAEPIDEGETPPEGESSPTAPENPEPTGDTSSVSTQPEVMVAKRDTMMKKGDDPKVEAATEPVDPDSAEPTSDQLADAMDRYRFIAPTTAGPLLIEVDLRMEEEPMSVAFNRHVDHVIKTADQDADGTVSIDELVDAETIWNTQFGRPQSGEDQRRRQAKNLDTNKDGSMDRDEMIGFLARDGGRSRPFDVRGSSYYRGQNSVRGPSSERINADRDRALSADEIANAPQQLMLLDRNGDQIVAESELMQFTPGEDPAWMNRGSGYRDDTATLLASFTQWSMLSYSLTGWWKQAQRLEREWVDDWMSGLDLDDDGELDKIETKALLDTPPHLTVIVSYPKKKTLKNKKVNVQIKHVAPGIEAKIVSEGDDSAMIQIDGMRLRICARDNPPAFANQAREILQALDANDDDAIDEDEIPEQLAQAYGSFEDADLDGDGKLVFEELVNFGQSTTPIWFYQVRLRASEQPDALFAWLDGDGDGRLVPREIRQSRDRLKQLDTNGDQTLSKAEFPEAYLIKLFRGEPRQDNQPDNMMQPQPGPRPENAPQWAIAMDTNRDGDISAEEFIGPSEQFQKLDANGDQFIALAELATDQKSDDSQ